MCTELEIINLVKTIDDDPYVNTATFMEDVTKHHKAAVERIRKYLVPCPMARHLIRYTPFENAGWFVFTNPATDKIHLKTRKGQYIF